MKKIVILILVLFFTAGCTNTKNTMNYVDTDDYFSTSLIEWANEKKYVVLAEEFNSGLYDVRYVFYDSNNVTKDNANTKEENVIIKVKAVLNDEGNIEKLEFPFNEDKIEESLEILTQFFNNKTFDLYVVSQLRSNLDIKSAEDLNKAIQTKSYFDKSISINKAVMTFTYKEGEPITFKYYLQS